MEKRQTLYSAAAAAAAQYPDGRALYYKGKYFTYAALMREIDALAAGFVKAGVRRGDAVTVCMPNVPESVYALYAINKIGAVAHMVHPLAPAAQLKKFTEKVGSRMLFVLSTALGEYASLAPDLPLGIVAVPPARSLGALKCAAYEFLHRKETVKRAPGVRYYDDIRVPRGRAEAAPYEEGRTAVYLHSGGTGGEPKVIELSDLAVNALAARVPHILSFMDRLEGTAMRAVLPMFHGFGLAMGVHAPLVYGAVSVLMPKFSTAETIGLLAKGRLNYLIGVPALYEALLKKPDFSGEKLKSIRIAFIGGDCVRPDLLQRFDGRMQEGGSGARLFEGYGLTETVTVCIVNLFSACRAGSVGKVLPGLECRILGDDGDVELKLDKTHVSFEIGSTRVVARLLEGEFIKYRSIIPATWSSLIRVNRQELAACIDRASLMARDGKNNLMKFSVGDNKLVITSNSEMGDAYEELEAAHTGDELTISFNIRFMSDIMKVVEDDEIVMRFNSAVSPCVICPTEGDAYTYLVLPVRNA